MDDPAPRKGRAAGEEALKCAGGRLHGRLPVSVELFHFPRVGQADTGRLAVPERLSPTRLDHISGGSTGRMKM